LLLTLRLGGLAGNMTFSRQDAKEQRKPFLSLLLLEEGLYSTPESRKIRSHTPTDLLEQLSGKCKTRIFWVLGFGFWVFVRANLF
jgi:hypothetical protein